MDGISNFVISFWKLQFWGILRIFGIDASKVALEEIV